MRSAFTIASEDPKLGKKGTKMEPPLSTATARSVIQKKKSMSSSSSSSQAPPRRSSALAALRIVTLDMPLLIVLSLYAACHLWVHFNETYLDPQLRLFRWRRQEKRKANELTYYGRVCTQNDLTATDPSQIMITPEMTTKQAVDSMLHHGISIFPDLLTKQTAQRLRDSIIEYNTKEENYFVIGKKTKEGKQVRYSYGIRVEQDEIVRQAIHEITTHPVLRPALEAVMGPSPAVYKFHAITSTYGATDQNFHYDVVPSKSAQMYARSFVPIYSLFIPLQNTTAKMGSTDICPGTHVCANGLGFCKKSAFRASGVADNWPAGYGALMNQQTTHRGRAHLDDAPDSDRVLFILAFTPRPRHTKYISDLETRGLSLGGSYATHWTQWGHSVLDLADNWKYMWNPIKTLRALGLFKTADVLWGWDWISVLMTRMANLEYPGRQDLMTSLENGTLSVIPEFIRPAVEEDLDDTAWYYFFIDLAANCEVFFRHASYVALAVYVAVTLGLNMALYKAGKRGRDELKVGRNLVRLIVIPAAVYLVLNATSKRIDNTPWAQHIRSRRLYQLSHNFRGPKLPSVLPHENDVLMLDDFQSEYLASYTRLHEIGHPGNKAFKQMVIDSATGFAHTLSDSLKLQLCSSLIQWNRQSQSRFLGKNHVNQWAELTRPMAMEYVHKQLLRQDNIFAEAAVRRIDYLVSETKFGTWRDTVMHRVHIPALLRSLELRIVRLPNKSSATKATVPKLSKDTRGLVSPHRLALSGTRSNKVLLLATQQKRRNNGIPPARPIREPFRGAWLRVGDRVEGRYENKFNEWYRGVIVGAAAHQMQWQVKYYDDEVSNDLCRECVRRFEPYRVGQYVDFKMDPDTEDWIAARILKVHHQDNNSTNNDGPAPPAYDFLTLDDKQTIKHFSTPHIRRYKTTAMFKYDPPFRLGQELEARWYEKGAKQHDGKWYLATIVNRNDDGTFNVEFFDGEYMRNLRSSDLRAF